MVFYATITPALEASEPTLPAELRAFLYACVDSIDQVDLLLSFRQRTTSTTVRELSRDTGVASIVLRPHLETLTARGLLRAEVGDEVRYHYAPQSAELRRYTDLLAEYYASHRDLVVRAVATRAARTFADAFRLRKDP